MKLMQRRPSTDHGLKAMAVAILFSAGTPGLLASQEPVVAPVLPTSPATNAKAPVVWTAARLEAEAAKIIGDALAAFVVESVAPSRNSRSRVSWDSQWTTAFSNAQSAGVKPSLWVRQEVTPLLNALEPERSTTGDGQAPESLKVLAATDLARLENLETSVATTESARRVAVAALRLSTARLSGDTTSLTKARTDAAERLEAVLELEVGDQPGRQCPLPIRQAAEIVLLREGLLSGEKLSGVMARLDTREFLFTAKIAKGLDAYSRAETPEARRAVATAVADDVCQAVSRADLFPEDWERLRWVLDGLDRLGDNLAPADSPISVTAARMYKYRGWNRTAREPALGNAQPAGWDGLLSDPAFIALPRALKLYFAASAASEINQRFRDREVPEETLRLYFERLLDGLNGNAEAANSAAFSAIQELLDAELSGVELLDPTRESLITSTIERLEKALAGTKNYSVARLRIALALRSREPATLPWSAALDVISSTKPEVPWRPQADDRLVKQTRLALPRVLSDAETWMKKPHAVERARLLVRTATMVTVEDLDLNVDARRALAGAAMLSSRERTGWAAEFQGLLHAVQARAAYTPWVDPADAEAFERARWASRLRQAGRGDDARKIALAVTGAQAEPGKSIVGRAAFWLAWAEVLESVSTPAAKTPGDSSDGDVRIRLRSLAAIDPSFGYVDDQTRLALLAGAGAPGGRKLTLDERDAFAAMNDAATRLKNLSERVEKAK